MSDPYSPLKVLHPHHRHRLDDLREGRQPYPAHVQIILSDLCQQSCSFCAYRWDGYTTNEMFYTVGEDGAKNHNPNRMIPTAKVLEVLDDCRVMGVGAVQFTGGGEPTLHPDHPLLFSYALDQGLECALVTNGVAWRCPQVLEQFAWVRFSMDAGYPETYAHVRKSHPSTFYKVYEHVSQLAAAKGGPLVGVGFVVTKDNWMEVVPAASRARDAGAHSFRLSAVFQPDGPGYFAGFYAEAARLCREAEGLATPRFRVTNMFGDRVEDLQQAHPDYGFCGYQHLTTYIGGDQNVYRCCNLAYNPRGLIGSIKDQRFKELWDSDDKFEDFAWFDAHGCPRCQFNQKNRTINYAISDDPTHVDFV